MTILEPFYRDTWVEVDLDCIEENVRNIQHNTKHPLHIMAIVKADGYGHGAVQVAEAAIKAGAPYLGVATLDEALQLRRHNISVPILVLGLTRPQDVKLAVEHQITVTVFQKEWIEQAIPLLTEENTLNIHLKFDTGMGRIGIRTKDEGKMVVDLIKRFPSFYVEGIFTHFATADELNLDYFHKQYERFKEVLTWINEWGLQPTYIHCGNSAAGIRFPEKAFNMFRLGISMYGLAPSLEMKANLPVKLKQAFSLKSKLTQVKHVPPNEGVSYGCTYKTTDWEWIGTLPIGYADGWYRYHSTNGGYVIINGEKAPFVGRICMDQCMVKLPYEMEVGAEATLISQVEGSGITMDDIALRLGTINYEIPCMIGQRVPRMYIKNQDIIHVRNRLNV